MPPQRLPRVARLLLRLSVPEDTCEQVVLDLEEMWARERAGRSRLTASLWMWREAASFALHFTGERLRDMLPARIGHLELKLVRRTIARTPLLTATAVASLAIGIALAAAAFGVVSGVMFGRLDVPQGERVVQLRDVDRLAGWDFFVDEATFVRRRAAFRTIDLAAYSTGSVLVERAGGSGRVVDAATLSANGFEVLREEPVAGRLFSLSDERAATLDICVLSTELARELFGSPSGALNATLRIDGRRLTVVGVMRSGFRFPYASSIWLPRAMSPLGKTPSFRLYGRLAPDASLANATAEFAVIAGRDTLVGVGPDRLGHRVLGFTELAGKPGVKWGLWLCVAALVVLMIVSAANVANLLLARAATRGFEFAVRAALGASRSRIAGQLVLEALFVATAAAIVGSLGAREALAWLRDAVSDFPYWVDLSLDWRVLAFIVAMAVVATAVVASVPVNRVLRTSLAGTMKDGQSPVRFGRLSTILIAVELAVAVGFLGGTASVGRGMATFGFGASGVNGDRTLIAQLYFGQPPSLERADAPSDPDIRRREWAAFEALTLQQADLLAQRLRASSLVASAALGSHFPGNEPTDRVVEIENDRAALMHRTRVVEVGDGYLATLGSSISRGRSFTAAELQRPGGGVLVNERFVSRYSLGNSLGRRIRFRSTTEAEQGVVEPWREIVGVVPDLALNPGNADEGDGVYLPLEPTNIMRIAIRARGNAAAVIPLLHQEVLGLSPRPRVQWAKTLSVQMAEPVTLFRTLGLGLTALGAIALILAAAGVYALLALRVTQSRRELAVRLAIGARGWRVAQTVVARSAWPAVIGFAAGGIVAFGITQLIATIPFEIERRTSVGVAGVLAVLGVVALLGCAIPLRRALRLRPIDLLRSG